MLKVVEVLAESDLNWEAAAQNAVDFATESVRSIRSIYIDNFKLKWKRVKYLNFALMRK